MLSINISYFIYLPVYSPIYFKNCKQSHKHNLISNFHDLSTRDMLANNPLWKILIPNYNLACCFVWVWNLVADIVGGKEAEGVWEWGVEKNIWT